MKKLELKANSFARKKPKTYPTVYTGLGLVFLFLLLDTMTTKYTVDVLGIRFEKGLLFRDQDSIDLVKVIDQGIHYNPVDLILGLRTVRLITRDVTSPVLYINGLSPKLANELFEFIKVNSTSSIVEYRKSEEFKKSRKE